LKRLSLVLGAIALASSAAFAADNYEVLDGTGSGLYIKSKDCGTFNGLALKCPQTTPSDAAGTPFGYSAWGAAPSGNVPGVNANVLTLPALPAFASTPTFNLGTLNGAATAAAQTSVQSTPGTPQTTAITIQGNASGVPVPVTGSFSASLSGWTPGGAFATPLSVSTASARVALPTGTVVVVYNTGSSAAYVQLGGSTVTASTSADVIGAGGWSAFTVGSNTYLAAVTASGTTSLNISGGSGLATGALAGSGGGGSVPTGSAGSPNSAVLSVQGVSGGTVLPVVIGAGSNIIGSVNAAQAGSWNIGNITGTVALPTGAATAANQTNVQSTPGTSQATAVTIQGNASGIAVPVSGTLAATQSGTWNIGSISTLPSLPAGANAIGSVSVSNFPGTQTVTGTVAATQSGTWNIGSISSLPALPSGSNTIGTVNAAQSGTWNVTNISGTVSLPTGAATAANQTSVESAPGTPQTTAITIQGNASGVAVPVSGTLAATQSGTWNIGSIATLPALPAGSNSIGSVTVNAADPCQGAMKSSVAFSGATGQFRIITGTASKKTYICHIRYSTSAVTSISIIEGTGSACATGAAAMDGSTTAANGRYEIAGGVESSGNGQGDIMHAATAADDVCFLQSGTATIAGRVTYVQQ